MSEIPEPAGRGLVFAVDLGGTHLRIGLVDDTGKIHKQLKRQTPKDESPNALVDALASVANEWRGEDRCPIIAASVMVPGPVDSAQAVVLSAPNLPSLINYGLKAVLQERLGWPVVLENDANAAAMGEMWIGAARGCRDVVSVTLGTGVGGGIVLGGRVWRGAHGAAGEIGHTTVDPFSGLKCKCGNTGCLELFASATAIVRMARESLSQFPQATLSAEGLTAEKVFDAGRDGDELALSVFKRAGKYLGIGLANLMTLIDPEIIVINGGVVNGWDLFEADMYQEVSERAFPATVQQVKIARAECGDNAGLLGAARLAFDEMG
ncbi:MAG TPA: ROK family protein [Pyrinomonadaceae bacterium]|jgi:glucokinase|nr:ROK family protein [Pyrinomonadaceae bacterium]